MQEDCYVERRGLESEWRHELERWMLKLSIDILCIQETHTIGSAYFINDDFLIILSSGEVQQRSYAGVGFIVSTRVRHAVSGFLQHSDRLASLRVRVPGGEACFVSVYAPTNEYCFEVWQSFYYEAQDFVFIAAGAWPNVRPRGLEC